MKPSKLISRIAVALVALCLALTLTIALINLAVFDEDLRPEVRDILQAAPPPSNGPNAYTAIWGINAAPDRDELDSGTKLVERFHSNREKLGLDGLTAEDFLELLGSNNDSEAWLKNFNCSSRTQSGCVSLMLANLQSTSSASQNSGLLLQRHQRILHMTNFVNWGNTTTSSTTPFPPYSTMMSLSQYKLTRLIKSGGSTAFLEQLSLDMLFWKMLIDQGSDLIDKMVGIAGVWNDLQFLSEYLASNELQADEIGLASSILEPLTSSQLNLAEAFESEQRNLSDILTKGTRSLPAFGPLVSDWLIQNNATANSYYQYVTGPIIKLNRLSGKEFAALTHINDSSRKPIGYDSVNDMITIWPGTLYNLGGKVLLSKILGFPADYIARVHDLNSMISLVRLQVYLQSRGEENADYLLSRLDTENPILNEELAGKNLVFDAKESHLKFNCLHKRSICEVRLD